MARPVVVQEAYVVPPTAGDVQAKTKLADFAAALPDDADEVVATANALFQRITGLTFDVVPVEQEPLVSRAVRGLAESAWMDESEDRLETLGDFDLIQSFSAGPYSETRRGAEDAMKARMIHPWPWLNRLLWLLLTDDQNDYWLAFFNPNQPPPAFEVQEIDWGANRRIGDPPSERTAGTEDGWGPGLPTYPGGSPDG